jgi:hypothetical protein
MEKFRIIIGYNNYQIGNYGSVYNTKFGRWKIVTPVDCGGYLAVRLYKNGKRKKLLVHRLVAENWIPNPLNKEYVNHRWGNKKDNRAIALNWMTPSENCQDMWDNALAIPNRGIKCYIAKLNDKKVIDARTRYSTGNYTIKQLADKNGVHKSTMSDALKRRTWKHI